MSPQFVNTNVSMVSCGAAVRFKDQVSKPVGDAEGDAWTKDQRILKNSTSTQGLSVSSVREFIIF